ncbi:MAG: PIG-L family deacetylase [Planctomycetaceae bacterium]|jgi:N-acetylglucosamine malate deacetylase 1|nr:PIG-L family deacetylase [Planctomycetaceae bacterium]
MPSVLAIAAHPDDIEFLMAGTMVRLRERGWELHYFNLCDGCLGSTTMDEATTRTVRLAEAQAAAKRLGAVHYPPIERDMELLYTIERLRQVAAVVRQANPDIVLTHSPVDYMEDHQNASRLAVSAAFARGMPNFKTLPPLPPIQKPVAVYHAQPHGHKTPLGEWVQAELWVDIATVFGEKEAALMCHASQRQWLDTSQGMDNYIATLRELALTAGRLSGTWQLSEGWRRHVHWGFCDPTYDPLASELASDVLK